MSKPLKKFLGREHFVALGIHTRREAVSRLSFYRITGRLAIPNDKRLSDFGKLGVVIVPRDDTKLGEIPEFGKYSRNAAGTAADPFAARCETFAIEMGSFRTVMDQMLSGELDRPQKFGQSALMFCDDLLAKQGLITANT